MRVEAMHWAEREIADQHAEKWVGQAMASLFESGGVDEPVAAWNAESWLYITERASIRLREEVRAVTRRGLMFADDFDRIEDSAGEGTGRTLGDCSVGDVVSMPGADFELNAVSVLATIYGPEIQSHPRYRGDPVDDDGNVEVLLGDPSEFNGYTFPGDTACFDPDRTPVGKPSDTVSPREG